MRITTESDGHVIGVKFSPSNNLPTVDHPAKVIEGTGLLYSDDIGELLTDKKPADNGNEALYVNRLTYTVRERPGSWWQGCCLREKRDKEVLKNVNIQVKRGQLTALLGNSGSGKTSLLDVIACRHQGKLKGKVTFGGKNLDEATFKKKCGYVIQSDRLLANLTVQEILMYTAQLKFANTDTASTAKERVSRIIAHMGLNHVANSKVGGHIVRGISGGERRRVSIAVQLLQDPDILLLDEPTTGLDSFTAHYLVSVLAKLARSQKRIILMSIHQPRSDIFGLFDQIGILSLGEVIYFGPQISLVPYFTRLGFPCPIYANPLDHYVDLASIDRRDAVSEEKTSVRVYELKKGYVESDIHKEIMNEMDKSSNEGTNNDSRKTKKYSSSIITSISLFSTLFRRMQLNLWRDKSGFSGRLTLFPTFAFFLWIFIWSLNNDIETAVQDRTGILFESMSAAPMMGLLNAVALFPAHRDLYSREHREGLYGCGHMLAAYFIHIVPFAIVATMFYSTWLYWGIGLSPDPGRFFIFSAVCLHMHYFGEILTVLFLIFFQNIEVGQSVCTLSLSVLAIIGPGLVRSQATLPEPFQYVAYAVNYKYASEILAANEYHGLQFSCDGG
ncbi:hypothetical protein CAPTEDRAFT_116801 [Capitella teleta]|uniref:ABC transporter domain-containing protein n=1 Tax=Capitella teleta TaxID=283909 RepID=R7TVY8_CAPTE|nr:hypothetical protein CAPTEDRAFT_116801 [Capitella teleta]|eukprot:ELT98073.1 hypothetical protein CAPTEDRAFT_116801 [Capitella teleta]